MARKKKAPEKEPNHERYLVTYADLITLLLVFFIVLFSSATLDKVKYQAVSESLSMAMGGGNYIIGKENGMTLVNQQGTKIGPPSRSTELTPQQKDKKNLADTKAQIDKVIKQDKLQGSVKTALSDRGLVISLSDTITFDPGKAEIKPQFRSTLLDLAKMVNKLDNQISVEGHTDDIPINNGEFKSNWQLAAIRATNVTEFLVNYANVPPGKVSAVSYGEFKPVSSNSTSDGRKQNRRVDIVVLNLEYNQKYSR